MSGSESGRPAGPAPWARNALVALAAFGSAALAGWLLWHSWRGRLPGRLPGGPGAQAEDPAGGALAGAAVNVRVHVRVLDAAGRDEPVGTALPRRVSVTLAGPTGQPYEARFDRVGLWMMETPPGEYTVAPQQASMGSWTWSLSGTGVSADPAGGWRVRVPPGRSPTIQVILQ